MKFATEMLRALSILDVGGETVEHHKVIEHGERVLDEKWSSRMTVFEFAGSHYCFVRYAPPDYTGEFGDGDPGEQVECDRVTRVEVISHEWI